jgi:hypothetical protein
MKFGLLKSQIENMLIESYKNESMKNNMFIFNELVLKNKNISRVFYLYDELNSNKGLNESVAGEFVNQSVIVYENLINKINPKELKEIQMWAGHIQCENTYTLVDDLFSNNVTNLESKIKSKNTILENLKTEPKKVKEIVNVPIKTMVNVANKTASNYIESLTESDKTELKKLLSSDDETIKESYFILKGKVISKLETLQEGEQDNEVTNRIDETIQKIQDESFDKVGYFKLRKLNENL